MEQEPAEGMLDMFPSTASSGPTPGMVSEVSLSSEDTSSSLSKLSRLDCRAGLSRAKSGQYKKKIISQSINRSRILFVLVDCSGRPGSKCNLDPSTKDNPLVTYKVTGSCLIELKHAYKKHSKASLNLTLSPPSSRNDWGNITIIRFQK